MQLVLFGCEAVVVEGTGGETLAEIHKAMITPLRDRNTVKFVQTVGIDVV